MCNSTGSEIKELFLKAYKETLNPTEQQSLSTHLETDPKLVFHIGLTPQKVSTPIKKGSVENCCSSRSHLLTWIHCSSHRAIFTFKLLATSKLESFSREKIRGTINRTLGLDPMILFSSS